MPALVARDALPRRQPAYIVAMDKETNLLFHRLWTKAVGSHDYVKREWRELTMRTHGRTKPVKFTVL